MFQVSFILLHKLLTRIWSRKEKQQNRKHRRNDKPKIQEKLLDFFIREFLVRYWNKFRSFGADGSKKKRPKKRHDLLSPHIVEPELDRKTKLYS